MVSLPSDLRLPWTRLPRATNEQLAEVGVESPLLAQLLRNRGINLPADARAYLEPPRPVAPALDEMAGLAPAVLRIERALRDGSRIVVYGDYDVDGLSGSTVLQRTLTALGGQVEVFIPHRDRHGYGLNAEVLRGLAEDGASLIVTVDCGVTASDEVRAANEAGLDVVVTDHHAVPPELPLATAIVNPHRADCTYPFKKLAGAGVALKVAQALVGRRLDAERRETLESALFELAALGTVSDVMPLEGENRAIVRHGLATLNWRPSAGLAALATRAGLTRPWIDAVDVAFRLAPRLNAAGRIAEATVAQHLLAADDAGETGRLADQLELLNTQRRDLAAEALEDARQQVATCGPELPAALVVFSAYPAGVLGLVAVRLVEETSRPVAVVEQTEGMSRGSVRGPIDFNAIGAVSACGEHLIRYGGHAGAAGFALDPERFTDFAETFLAAVEGQELVPRPPAGQVADCLLRPSTVDLALLDLLERVGPFGQGCPEPLFETRALQVREARVVGERHLRLRLWGEGRLLAGIAFNGAGEIPAVGSHVDVLYRVRPNVWQGERRAELHVVGWQPSTT